LEAEHLGLERVGLHVVRVAREGAVEVLERLVVLLVADVELGALDVGVGGTAVGAGEEEQRAHEGDGETRRGEVSHDGCGRRGGGGVGAGAGETGPNSTKSYEYLPPSTSWEGPR